jgi:hypothetical protein
VVQQGMWSLLEVIAWYREGAGGSLRASGGCSKVAQVSLEVASGCREVAERSLEVVAEGWQEVVRCSPRSLSVH